MFASFKAKLAAVVLGLAMLAPVSAQALDWPEFTREAFQASQAEGKTIMIATYADWCTTCRAMEPALEAARVDDFLEGVVFFKVDYDTQRDVMVELNVFDRSWVIVFNGSEEVARAYAVFRLEEILDLAWLGL
jgi:thiol:disulfide interchange protein